MRQLLEREETSQGHDALVCVQAPHGRKATVVVADDHPLFIEAMKLALTDHGIDVIGSTVRGDGVVPLVEELCPDVVLLDVAMPGMDGLECLAALSERCPAVKVIVVSGNDRPHVVDRALELGAVCFVGKGVETEDLARAVGLVTGNSPVVISRRMLEQSSAGAAAVILPPRDVAETLTKREHEILALVTDGNSNAQIARMLWVTEQTVKFHLSNVYRKLEVANRTQACAKARHLGIFDSRRASA